MVTITQSRLASRRLLVTNIDDLISIRSSQEKLDLVQKIGVSQAFPKYVSRDKRISDTGQDPDDFIKTSMRYMIARMANTYHEPLQGMGFVYAHSFENDTNDDSFVKIGSTDNVQRRLKQLKRDSIKKGFGLYKCTLLVLPVLRYNAATYLESYIQGCIHPEDRVIGEVEWAFDTLGLFRTLVSVFAVAHYLQWKQNRGNR